MDHVIEVEGLAKTFRPPFRTRKVEAVKSVTFAVEKGEVYGFLGPNGAGKTTTIKVLTGLIRPTAGKVAVLGGAPRDIGVRQRVGFLPEQPYFYDYLKPRELLDTFGRLFGMDRALRKRRIDELLELVGLTHARERRLRKFSKGMLQRVGIAQALLNDPELIILDEPMSGLDPIGRKEVSDLVASLKAEGKTIFFSSHILADIERLCDRVMIIDQGLMKAAGRLGELLAGGRQEKEVLVGGDKDVSGIAEKPGVVRVEAMGADATKIVCSGAGFEDVLRGLLDGGFSVVSVTDGRMSLESLIMDLAGQGAEPPTGEVAP
ncbi:MAG: ABC transporter ATP-binding protein [Deltaproteobacteria bacterium]|nr:ABC transporter ATP-binding protein [Deltaproteobacteria bacterium]